MAGHTPWRHILHKGALSPADKALVDAIAEETGMSRSNAWRLLQAERGNPIGDVVFQMPDGTYRDLPQPARNHILELLADR